MLRRSIFWFAALFVLASAAHGADLKVMSFNIRYGTAEDGLHAWPRRAALVTGTITAFDPDLLGTQECLAFQRDELMAALPGYAVVAVGRDDGAETGEMCACFYREERFQLLDSGTFWLSERPQKVASRGWDAALPRIATWLRLRDRSTDSELLWLNTHFDHRGKEARRESAALLHRWLNDHRETAAVIVTGDFNAAAGTEAGSVHQTLLSGVTDPVIRLSDTWTAVHGAEEPTVGTFNGFGDDLRRERIDWILVSLDVDVVAAAIDRTRHGDLYPSDHFPVTALVKLP